MQRLAQQHHVKGAIAIVLDALQHVAMVYRQAPLDTVLHVQRIDLDAPHLALPLVLELEQQVAIATAQIQHP